jgi:putative intracellular protease/amidase
MKQALNASLDVLMIPGGGGTWPLLDEKTDPKGVAPLLDWVRRMMDQTVKLITSVCTGAVVLARAGLLDGKPPRPTTALSRGWRSRVHRSFGTACRAGSTRGVT